MIFEGSLLSIIGLIWSHDHNTVYILPHRITTSSIAPRSLSCHVQHTHIVGPKSVFDLAHEPFRVIDSSQAPTKQVKPVFQLHKVLKFKLSPDSEIQNVTAKEAK